MMLLMLAAHAAAAGVADPPAPAAPSGSCSGECRRPWFHYTATNLTTSDPNGLMWRRTASGEVSYEYFHQDRGSYTKDHPQYCWGSEGNPASAWGHASSPDMLHWKGMPVSGVCGSTGGGTMLPPDFRGPNGERWTSVMVASAPGGAPMDTNGTGRGLKLWTSNNTELTYEMYSPPGTRCHPKYHLCDACVICPEKVKPGPSNPPPAVRTSFLGDSFTWSEPPWNMPSSNRTYYVLSGSGTCPQQKAGIPSEWCGWGHGNLEGGAMALLFSSKNLVDFTFNSVFYDNKRSADKMPINAGDGALLY